MPEFVYKGRTTAGAPVSGRLDASHSGAVATHLQSRGITPVEIRESVVAAGIDLEQVWRRLGGGRPRLDDLILFCRQMHTITKSGLPLLKGLQGLAETTHNPVLRETLHEVLDSLESGRGLAASLSRFPTVFPPLMLNIVDVGEVTGTLDTAFKRLHEYLTLQREIQDRVRAASRYPMIVLAAIAAAITVITVFVIPNFAPVFRSLGDAIPMPTRIIMGVSQFAQDHGLWLAALGVAMWLGFKAWTRSEAGQLHWGRIRLDIPVVGIIAREVALARITRSLALALEAGLPANQTLTAIAGATGNEYLAQLVLGMRSGIERGESMAQASAQTGLFTPLIQQMIAVGEETGALSELLGECADHYEREVDYRLQNLSAALEPLLIVAVGGCVLILALGVFLPLWDMVGKAKGF